MTNAVIKYKDMTVWQKSMDLVVLVYKITNDLPEEEKFGLISQMRRCAISIPSNIAEGFERNSTREYIQFLSIAQGSKSELVTQLEICKRLKYLNDIEDILSLCSEIGGMLNVLIEKLKEKIK